MQPLFTAEQKKWNSTAGILFAEDFSKYHIQGAHAHLNEWFYDFSQPWWRFKMIGILHSLQISTAQYDQENWFPDQILRMNIHRG